MMKNREEWLNSMKDFMEPVFKSHGYEFSNPILVSSGFCTKKTAVGQCFAPVGKTDTIHIFIDPSRGYGMDVAEILCHELIHAALGNKEGHGKLFKGACKKLGLKPTRFTGATPEFIRWCRPFIDRLGPYPHEILKRPMTTRFQSKMKIVKCVQCSFWVRIDEELLLPKRICCPYCQDPLLTKEEITKNKKSKL